MRMTHSLVKVARLLAADPDGRHWGYPLSRESGVPSGALYPMLTRLLDEGWLADGWEDPSTVRGRRPPRRYYELTDKGRQGITELLAKAGTDRRFVDLFPVT